MHDDSYQEGRYLCGRCGQRIATSHQEPVPLSVDWPVGGRWRIWLHSKCARALIDELAARRERP
jgi:hypothetical protein